jgi:hypothetical protein
MLAALEKSFIQLESLEVIYPKNIGVLPGDD